MGLVLVLFSYAHILTNIGQHYTRTHSELDAEAMFVMNKRVRKAVLTWGAAGLMATLPLAAGSMPPMADAAMNSNMAEGSQGSDVSELQSRLGFLGYYHGPVNGNFGWSTYWAVRDFQYAFGLPIDGVAGTATIAKLRLATQAWKPSPSTSTTSSTSAPSASAPATPATSTGGFSASDISLMAHVVYGEARGQPFVGQVAVAAVILNRYHSSLFPHSIPGIIYQPGAFTSISNGQAWLGLHAQNTEAVMDAINGYDPTHGALYYWNPATATSSWVWSQPIITTIGQHVFAK